MTSMESGKRKGTIPVVCRRLLRLAAAGILICAPAFGEEEQKAASDSEKPKVYTNKDLQKYKGPAPRPAGRILDMTAAASAAEAPPAPPMTQAEKERRIEALRSQIAAADARISAIDARMRSLHHPLLPRPQVAEDEQLAEGGMDSRQILERIEAERQALLAQSAALKTELETLEAAPVAPGPDAGDAVRTEGATEPPPQQP